MASTQGSLFGRILPAGAPAGLSFQPDFLSHDEERELLRHVEALPFGEVRMRGVVAKRTVVHFGWDYDYTGWSIHKTDPLPDWIFDARMRAAAFAGLAPEKLVAMLVSRYPEGAGIGWHRDAPMFGDTVVGLSLGAPTTMRLRKIKEPRGKPIALALTPRSIYVLSGDARSRWQHGITTTPGLRYAITFRTIPDESRWEKRATAGS